MNRRQAITRIGAVLGAAVSGPTAAALLSGCRAPGSGSPLRALSADQFEYLGLLAETIIPSTETPGALEAGVPGFIDLLLAEYYPAAESRAFLVGIGEFRLAFDPDGGFRGLTGGAREGRLAGFDEEAFRLPPSGRTIGDPFEPAGWYRRLKEMVVSGYYTSAVGATEDLRPNPMGPYQGDVSVAETGGAWA